MPVYQSALTTAIFLGLIAGCSSIHAPPHAPSAPQAKTTIVDGPPNIAPDLDAIADAQPKFEPYSKYGNPPTYVVFNTRYYTKASSVGHKEIGIASWYGSKFHGQRTSSGETYDMFAMTAAHTSLPLPTYAKITNLENKRSVIVKINDRGPFHNNRIIDLSYAAAAKLGYADKGTARVSIETITFPQHLTEPTHQATQHSQESGHYVQVGAFKSRQSAEQLQNQLKTLHSSAKVTHVSHQQPSFYRVRLGPFKDRAKATQLASAVDSIGLKPLIITE